MPRHPELGSKENVTSSRAGVPSSHMTSFSFPSEFDSDDVSSGDMSSGGAAFDAAMLHGATFDAVISDATAFDMAAFDATASDATASDAASGRGAARLECARYARLLTALFDGESSTRDAALARAHLERCARCTQEWLGWKQTRAFLQSAPPPSVPPGLLTRILLFCRLSMLRHAALASAPDRRIATSGAQGLAEIVENELQPTSALPWRAPVGAKNADFMEADGDEDEAALRPIFHNDAVPPAQLRQAILDRTTGARQSDAPETGCGEMATRNSPPRRHSERLTPHEYSCGGSTRPARSLTAFAMHAARAMHRVAPLAGPAMLGWIAFSTYEPQVIPGLPPAQTTPGIVPTPGFSSHTRSNAVASQTPRALSTAATPDGHVAPKPANSAVPIIAPRVATAPQAATAPVAARAGVPLSNATPSVAIRAVAGTPRAALSRALDSTSSDSTSAPQANAAAHLASSAPARETQAGPSVRARTAAPRQVGFAVGDAGRRFGSSTAASLRIVPHVATATRQETPRTAATIPNARLAAFHPNGAPRASRATMRSSSRPAPRLAIARWKASFRLAPALSASPSALASPSTRATQGLNLLKVSSHAISERAQTLSWRPASRLAPSSGAFDDENDVAREGADDLRNDSDPQTLRDMMNEYSAALLDDGSDAAAPNAS